MRFGFSNRELKDLFVAWVLLCIAFAFVLPKSTSFGVRIWVAGITVGLGFLLHEIGHKIVAQHFGKFAEFHANIPMLLLSIPLALTGTIFAAPGAVFISGFVSKKENGLIAAAGPIVNVILALVFLAVFYVVPAGSLQLIAGFGLLINASLALFNLLPFWIFDGAKIISWNKGAYAILVIASVLVMFVATALVPL